MKTARSLNPEVNYSTIVCTGLSKWKTEHLVDDYRFEVYDDRTRLHISFSDRLVSNAKVGLGARHVMFEYGVDTLSMYWQGRQKGQLRFRITPDDDRLSPDDMIGFLNHPLGAIVTVTQDHLDRASVCDAVKPPEGPQVGIAAAALEALVSHPDISTFLLTRAEKGMALDLKLSAETTMPVFADGEGNRMVCFSVYTDRLDLSWATGAGRTEERSWQLRELDRYRSPDGALTDLMGIAITSISGDEERDFRGKASNPVWRMVRGLEICLEGSRWGGYVSGA
jgi:hypothetical protein